MNETFSTSPYDFGKGLYALNLCRELTVRSFHRSALWLESLVSYISYLLSRSLNLLNPFPESLAEIMEKSVKSFNTLQSDFTVVIQVVLL